MSTQPAEPPRAVPALPRLEVVIVNDFAEVTGGSDRVALGEAAWLAERGHRVTVIAGAGRPAAELLAAGVEVRLTGQSSTIADPNRARAATQGIWNRRAASLLSEALGDVGAERAVIHIHGFTKVLSASVVRAAVGSGIPLVATMHDYFAACPNGGFFNYQTEEVCPLKPLSPRCIATHCDVRSYSHKLWRVARTAVQRTAGAMPRGVSELIAPSHFAARVLRPYLPEAAHLHVVPNPVPGTRRPAARPGANRPFVFLGRLARDKGPALLARAARAAGVPVVFIGEGEEREAILRANPDAEITGWLETPAVRERLRGARALVSASLWYETQGLSPLEAASHGVPSVVSDVSVLRELVADGESGLWFRGGDVEDLTAKLSALHLDSALVERLGARAYEDFWSGGWDVQTHVRRLEAVYGSLV